MESVDRNNSSLISKTALKIFFIGIYLVINLLLIIIGNPRYEVSDDFMMELIASGTYGMPDGHIMFSNTIYGSMLSGLYTVCPTINWYYMIQTIITLLSGAVIVYLLVEKTDDALNGFIITALFSLFTSQDLYILPQFTKTATITVMAGGLLFIYSLFEKKKKALVIGLLLGITGSMIRFMGVLIAGPFLIIYFISLISLSELKGIKGFLLQKALPVVIVILALLGVHWMQDITYSTEDYAMYQDYSEARAAVVDYPMPDYDEIKEELKEIDISENDYSMIRNWMFDDISVFSLKKMQSLRSILSGYRKAHRKSILSALASIYRRGQILYPIAIGCMLAGVLCIITNLKKWYIPVVCMILIAVFFTHFSLQGRMVYRIEFSYYISALILILMQCRDFKLSRTLQYIMAVFFILAFGFNYHSYVFPQETTQISDNEYIEYIDETFNYSWDYDRDKYTKTVRCGKIRPAFLKEVNADQEKIYLMEFPTCIQSFYYDFSVWDSTADSFPKNVVYLGGVTAYHPVMNQLLVNNDFSSWLDSLIQDNVFFVGNKMQDKVLAYFAEYGYENVKMKLVNEIDGYKIWKYYKE